MLKPSKSRFSARKPRLTDEDGRSQSLHAYSQARIDDLIIVPTRQAAPTISLSGFLLLVASFFLFKGGAIAWIGAAEYAASVEGLASGTLFEQAAAFVMMPDGLSQFFASLLQGQLA